MKLIFMTLATLSTASALTLSNTAYAGTFQQRDVAGWTAYQASDACYVAHGDSEHVIFLASKSPDRVALVLALKPQVPMRSVVPIALGWSRQFMGKAEVTPLLPFFAYGVTTLGESMVAWDFPKSDLDKYQNYFSLSFTDLKTINGAIQIGGMAQARLVLMECVAQFGK